MLDRLRVTSSSTADGNVLIDETLECGKRPFPIVALNQYNSPSPLTNKRALRILREDWYTPSGTFPRMNRKSSGAFSKKTRST